MRTILRLRAFLSKHWRKLVTALAGVGVFVLALFKLRKPSEPPSVAREGLTGTEEAKQVHQNEQRIRAEALGARSAQEYAAQQAAELGAAAKQRAEEQRLRDAAVDAETDIGKANAYADTVSARKDGSS